MDHSEFQCQDQHNSLITLSARIRFQFSISSTSPKKSSEWKMAKIVFFGRSDAGQDNLNKRFFTLNTVDMDIRYM
jgi:hypothetical protein